MARLRGTLRAEVCSCPGERAVVRGSPGLAAARLCFDVRWLVGRVAAVSLSLPFVIAAAPHRTTSCSKFANSPHYSQTLRRLEYFLFIQKNRCMMCYSFENISLEELLMGVNKMILFSTPAKIAHRRFCWYSLY